MSGNGQSLLEQLQAEMDRMAKHTKQPEVLRELFEALGNDPFVIAECLARPVLTERLSATPTAATTQRRWSPASAKEAQRANEIAEPMAAANR